MKINIVAFCFLARGWALFVSSARRPRQRVYTLWSGAVRKFGRQLTRRYRRIGILSYSLFGSAHNRFQKSSGYSYLKRNLAFLRRCKSDTSSSARLDFASQVTPATVCHDKPPPKSEIGRPISCFNFCAAAGKFISRDVSFEFYGRGEKISTAGRNILR